jgi:hypothetical protein
MAPDAYRLVSAEWKVLLPYFDIDPGESERRSGTAVLLELANDARHWPRAAWALAMSSPGATGAHWGDSLRRGASHNAVALHLLPFWLAQELATRSGPDAALQVSSAIYHDPGDSMVVARGPLVRAITYLSRGQWHLLRGDSTAAAREWRWHENNDLQGWPAGPPQDGELDAALSAPVRLVRATLACNTGDHLSGRRLLTRARELWASADPPFGEQWAVRRVAELACQ